MLKEFFTWIYMVVFYGKYRKMEINFFTEILTRMQKVIRAKFFSLHQTDIRYCIKINKKGFYSLLQSLPKIKWNVLSCKLRKAWEKYYSNFILFAFLRIYESNLSSSNRFSE